MNNGLKYVFSLLLLGLGVLSGLALSGQIGRKGEAAGSEGKDALDVDGRVSRLEERLQGLELAIRSLSDSRGSTVQQAGQGIGDLEEIERANGLDEAGLQLAREQKLSEYRNRFLDETVDAQWSATAMKELQVKVASDQMLASAPGLPDEWSVDCRSTMCEITFEFSDAAMAADWSEIYLTDVGGTLGHIWTTEIQQPDGSTQIVMYGTRGNGG
ncbi:hypothetical protein [Arenimonas aestuarii]